MEEMLLNLQKQGFCPITRKKLTDTEVIRFVGKEKTIFLAKEAVEMAAKELRLDSPPYQITSVMERNAGIVGVISYKTVKRNLAAQLYVNTKLTVRELIDKPDDMRPSRGGYNRP
ncbi:MAG TPA: hypothetical protein P5230_03175 [Candidatus Magasanikbacteria bacterium]|nr:hypothetical protein [Candidatus Magasanikbacteria bacterium]